MNRALRIPSLGEVETLCDMYFLRSYRLTSGVFVVYRKSPLQRGRLSLIYWVLQKRRDTQLQGLSLGS